ncbi:MAG TPA: hypothetical protein VGK99_03385 [Acidobacteriota bacterium]|jgi:predicted anti-sigma-YlaC factor YlaD
MTNEKTHRRARHLLGERSFTELNREDTAWLEQHLEACPECAGFAESVAQAITALRMSTAVAPPALVAATRRSVRIHARFLQQTESRERMLMLSCALAAIWGALLQPYLWRVIRWVAEGLHMPDPVWQATFVVAYLLPGIAAAAAFLGRRRTEDVASPGVSGRRTR